MTQYATLNQFQAYAKITTILSVAEEEMMNLALTNATATIDTLTHRTFVCAVDSTRTHDALRNVEGLRLWLNGDLAVLTSVTNGDGATVPLTSIQPYPGYGTPHYALNLKHNSGLSWTYVNDLEDAISVVGRWAYSVTPPDTIVQATLRLANWFYRQREQGLDLERAVIVGNATIAPSRIPADVITLIRPYLKKV